MSDLYILAYAMMLTPVGVAVLGGTGLAVVYLLIVFVAFINEPRSTYRVDDWLDPGSTRRHKSST